MVVKERQNGWDERLLHVEAVSDSSVKAVTGLTPNEVQLGRLLRLPTTIIERRGASYHQGLGRDQLEYCNLGQKREKREHHTIALSRIARGNQELNNTYHKRPRYTVGNWVGSMMVRRVRNQDD